MGKARIFIEPGTRFGRLVAKARAPLPGIERWDCECDCGQTKVVSKYDLLNGDCKSCGCFRREFIGNKFRVHGHTNGARRSREHTSWTKMIARCTDRRDPLYQEYGARGIGVCERWLDYSNFLSDMGPRPMWTTLDRIRNAEGYEPGNCRWASHSVQCQNRSIAHMLTYQGETLNLVEWARRLGMKSGTLQQRINGYGWSVERALTQPVKRRTAQAVDAVHATQSA